MAEKVTPAVNQTQENITQPVEERVKQGCLMILKVAMENPTWNDKGQVECP